MKGFERLRIRPNFMLDFWTKFCGPIYLPQWYLRLIEAATVISALFVLHQLYEYHEIVVLAQSAHLRIPSSSSVSLSLSTFALLLILRSASARRPS
jgi:hypothetical protein